MFTAHLSWWIGATCQMDMMHIKKTIDSGRVSSPHVVKLVRVLFLWQILDIRAAMLLLLLLSHSYSDSFIWFWKSNCKWMKCKAYWKAKTTLCSLHMDILLSLRHTISTCTSLSSQGDQNTMWWNPILSSNLGVQCWLSCYATLTFPNRKCWIRFLVCRVYSPAQCTGSRGKAALKC